MKIADLEPADVRLRLRTQGLGLDTGPFRFRIKSTVREVAVSIGLLYADFPLVSNGTFFDFHACVRRSRGLRRLIRTQSIFDLDGNIPFKPLPGKQAFALLEWGMNWCIYSHAHHYLIIHGAVLERSGFAILLPAPSGSGKSTLCAGLMHRGWRLLSDELILIDPHTGLVHGLGRPISIKNQSIDILRRFAPEAVISDPIPDTTKGTVAHMRPSIESVVRMAEPARPRWVLFPCYKPNTPVQTTSIEKADAFMRLVENAFNYSILGPVGFEAMCEVVDCSEALSIEYGELSDAIESVNSATSSSAMDLG